jgi:hypothetical protein
MNKALRSNSRLEVGMQRKRGLPAKQVMGDIRAGMTDEGLMEKYDLDVLVLLRLFDKLIETGLLTEEDLRVRREFFEGTVELDLDGVICARVRSAPASEMVWVTDGAGTRYLCPRGVLNNGKQASRSNFGHLLDVGGAPMVLPEYQKECRIPDEAGWVTSPSPETAGID